MKIDNKKNTLKIWLQKLVATVVFTPVLMVILFSRTFREPVLGVDRNFYILAAILLYGGLLAWHLIRRPAYVFFSDNGEKIILRYYPVRALNRKKSSVEIPKDQFVKYEVKKFFPGGETIILYRRLPKGVARYPGVSLSIMNKADRKKLKEALSQYVSEGK